MSEKEKEHLQNQYENASKAYSRIAYFTFTFSIFSTFLFFTLYNKINFNHRQEDAKEQLSREIRAVGLRYKKLLEDSSKFYNYAVYESIFRAIPNQYRELHNDEMNKFTQKVYELNRDTNLLIEAKREVFASALKEYFPGEEYFCGLLFRNTDRLINMKEYLTSNWENRFQYIVFGSVMDTEIEDERHSKYIINEYNVSVSVYHSMLNIFSVGKENPDTMKYLIENSQLVSSEILKNLDRSIPDLTLPMGQVKIKTGDLLSFVSVIMIYLLFMLSVYQKRQRRLEAKLNRSTLFWGFPVFYSNRDPIRNIYQSIEKNQWKNVRVIFFNSTIWLIFLFAPILLSLESVFTDPELAYWNYKGIFRRFSYNHYFIVYCFKLVLLFLVLLLVIYLTNERQGRAKISIRVKIVTYIIGFLVVCFKAFHTQLIYFSITKMLNHQTGKYYNVPEINFSGGFIPQLLILIIVYYFFCKLILHSLKNGNRTAHLAIILTATLFTLFKYAFYVSFITFQLPDNLLQFINLIDSDPKYLFE